MQLSNLTFLLASGAFGRLCVFIAVGIKYRSRPQKGAIEVEGTGVELATASSTYGSE